MFFSPSKPMPYNTSMSGCIQLYIHICTHECTWVLQRNLKVQIRIGNHMNSSPMKSTKVQNPRRSRGIPVSTLLICTANLSKTHGCRRKSLHGMIYACATKCTRMRTLLTDGLGHTMSSPAVPVSRTRTFKQNPPHYFSSPWCALAVSNRS